MVEDIKISDKYIINRNSPTFITAEIGQNHQGDINQAKQLIRAAKECGANCVKFQKTNLDEKFTKTVLNRQYNNVNSFGATYGSHKAHLEFTKQQFVELQQYANDCGILFAATPMDCKSLDFLTTLKVPFIKIGSGDANNPILIRKAAQTNLPLFISTGMLDFENVQNLYKLVSEYHKRFVLFYCISAYPTPLNQLNLTIIDLYKTQFPDIIIGYSGHEIGVEMTVAAVAMGAKVIERHFTLDKNQKGSDHKSSLTPIEFQQLVTSIRNLEVAMGKPKKILQNCELACYEKLGKSIVASRNLVNGTVLTVHDLKIKVADSKGVDGWQLYSIIGKVLKRDVEEDQVILENYLQ